MSVTTVDNADAHAKALGEAKEEWHISEGAFSDQRTAELEDLEFEGGKHFSEKYLSWMKDQNALVFTFDQLSGPIAKITNAPVQRIIVRPDGGGADPRSAGYWQGICRRVENLSGADAIYKWGRMHATKAGRGFWGVRHDFFNAMEVRADKNYSPDVFQQDIRIEPFIFQHAVYEDPRCRQLDFSDQRFTIVCEDLHWSEYTRLHGEAALTSWDGMRGAGDCPPTWGTEKIVRVAHRYWIDDIEIPLCLLRNGTVVPKGSGYSPADIQAEHTFRVPTVKYMKFSWGEVLVAPKPVAGRYIPIVKIAGERRVIDGKDDCRGLVRGAKDPQRIVDFMETKLAKIVDIATWQTIAAEVDSIKHDPSWQNININQPDIVTFRGTREGTGDPLPIPFVLSGKPDVGAVALAATRASMNLRHALGVSDVTPDEQRPEQSGKAIKARQVEQVQTTSNFSEATAFGIVHTGRIIISMGRQIYDAARVLRINGEDEKPIEVVTYKGQGQQEAAQQKAAEVSQDPQIQHMLDVSYGDFDVTFAAGKGYQSGREETVDILQNAVPLMPPPMQIKAWPILIKNMDAPGMAELAKAIEPPDPKSQTVPIEEAQKAQMVIEQLTQTVNDLKQQADSKQAELDSKERIAQADNDTKLQIEQQRADLQRDIEGIKAELEWKKAELQAQQAEAARREGFAHDHAQGVVGRAHEHASTVDQREFEEAHPPKGEGE